MFAPVPVAPPSEPVAVEPPPPPLPPRPDPPRFNVPAAGFCSSALLPRPPSGGRSGLAELNVRQPVPEAPTVASSLVDQLTGLEAVADDLLPSRRGRKCTQLAVTRGFSNR